MSKPGQSDQHGTTAEERRLAQDAQRAQNWKRWGPYVSERQWGTVREDYSATGACWDFFPHDHARSRAYRWGEDGILGITDRECRLCFAMAMWNGKDPILKERLFGLTGPEGNHGEDVKEEYFYLDSTPTHSYMKGLYKYPQAEYPYERLVSENRRRGRAEPEFEIGEAGVFDQGRYFDVQVEYAKNDPDDVLVRVTVTNRGQERATIHLLPTFWYRNTWSWGCTHEGCWIKPRLSRAGEARVLGEHVSLGRTMMAFGPATTSGGKGASKRAGKKSSSASQPTMLFCDNETNAKRLWGVAESPRYPKDAFHEYVVDGRRDAVNPGEFGTKCAAHYVLDLAPGEAVVVQARMFPAEKAAPGERDLSDGVGCDFDEVFSRRLAEADEFYGSKIPGHLDADARAVARQAYAGLMWSKQFYHYSVKDWLDGDPNQVKPPEERTLPGHRNVEWQHLFNRDVISMPDKWEYPWYAAWDLAFHVVAIAKVDPEFAKSQLVLMLREWYMHPNGQIPAYEFAFGDVNPPVHAWACWRVYKMTGKRGQRDRLFLARVFHKLLINFTWWVNRKDPEGKNLFSGGFLGLDNIGVFDRNQPLPSGVRLEQADGTAWMAFYCGTMLSIALELASEDPAYDDVASKFFEHFVSITDAMNHLGGTGLWDDEDGFYYDQLLVHGEARRMKVRSMVGIIPVFAVEVLEESMIRRVPGFRKRMQWFLDHRHDLSKTISYMKIEGDGAGDHGHVHRLLAIPTRERLERLLRYVLDENEFLSPFGVRALSRYHKDHPYTFNEDGREYSVNYAPGESETGMFGGNSNWRGPIWFPVNYLLVEALERYHHFYGESFKVECPVGSGEMHTLGEVAAGLRLRLSRLFLPDAEGKRPCHGGDGKFASDPAWKDLVLFHEYFHGDTGKGIGASHQTGWTGLITELLHDG
ncbi:MAG: glucosidase [Phycisphaerales bacterium]